MQQSSFIGPRIKWSAGFAATVLLPRRQRIPTASLQSISFLEMAYLQLLPGAFDAWMLLLRY